MTPERSPGFVKICATTRNSGKRKIGCMRQHSRQWMVIRVTDTGIGIRKEPASASLEQSTADLAGLNILLIEDEPSTREGTASLLESYGAQVRAVETASAARDAYSLQRPTIIISDIGLPGEDGYVLLQQIRCLERQQGIARVPAVALTAYALTEDRERALEAGYDAHLAKPVDPDKLLLQIAQLTGKRG